MKITLSPEATQALKELTEKLQSILNGPCRNSSLLVSQLVLQFNARLGPTDLSKLAGRLLTPVDKKNALIKKLAELAHNTDELTALKILEKSVRKLDHSSADFCENKAEK